MINNKRRELSLVEWRNHTNNEVQILKDIQQSSISVDKTSQFRVRPPQLRYLFSRVESYYRWFSICKGIKIAGPTLDLVLQTDLRKSFLLMVYAIKLK